MDTRRFTDLMPDGTAATFADIQPGWWIQVYIGSWPFDTVCGYVTAVHSGGAVTAQLDRHGTRFVPGRRVCGALRPLDG